MEAVARARNWREWAVCRGASWEEMMPENPADNQAGKSYCQQCLVKTECLDIALQTGSRWGIWGGLAEAERAVLHDAWDRQHEPVVQKPTRRPGRILSDVDRVELQDLDAERGHVARARYRLKVAMLYESGVSMRQLLAAGVPNDRMVWRAIAEYKRKLKAPAAATHQRAAIAPRRSTDQVTRARRNFAHLAKTAPTAEGREYWARRVQKLEEQQ